MADLACNRTILALLNSSQPAAATTHLRNSEFIVTLLEGLNKCNIFEFNVHCISYCTRHECLDECLSAFEYIYKVLMKGI